MTHPDGIVKVYPLERLTRLYDGIEQLEDEIWEDDASDSHEPYPYPELEPVWLMDDDGHWKPALDNDNDWEEMDEDDEENQIEDQEDDQAMNIDPPGWYIKTRDVSETQDNVDAMTVVDASLVDSDDAQRARSRSPEKFGVSEDEESSWTRFDILSFAPRDHAFYLSPHAQPSKSFLGRLTKEYRALASSLPGEIRLHRYLLIYSQVYQSLFLFEHMKTELIC